MRFTFEDQAVLVVPRFDRTPRRGGGILRTPQQAFLQAHGLEFGQKYQEHGGPGLQDGLRLLEGSRNRAADQRLLLKTQIVNGLLVAIAGHARNCSLSLGPGGCAMTPLCDSLSAAPACRTGAFRPRDLRLAMLVGGRRHDRLDQIQPRQFDETAARTQVPPDIRRQAFSELAEAGPATIEAVAGTLPGDFPDRVAGPALDQVRNRMVLLGDQVAAGLVGRS